MHLLLLVVFFVSLCIPPAWSAPAVSQFGTSSSATVDSDANLGGLPKPYANSTTTGTVDCAAGALSSTTIVVTSAAQFDSTGGVAVIEAQGKANTFRYTSIASNTFNGVANTENGSLSTCTSNYAPGARVYSSDTLISPVRDTALMDAIQNTQKVVGTKVVTPASLGVSTCAAALAIIGTTNRTIFRIDSDMNCAIPSSWFKNVTFQCAGGLLDCDSLSDALTIRGPIDCDEGQQLFTDFAVDSVKLASFNQVMTKNYTSLWGDIAGDGVDDSAAIQAAINASQGGYVNPVIISPGQHDIGTAITTSGGAQYDFMHIKGSSTMRTILMGTSATGNVVTVTGRKTLIEDLTIEGNATRQAGSSGHGIYADNDPSGAAATIGHLILRNLFVLHQPQDGVFVMDPELHYYTNVDISTNGRYGLHWEQSTPALRPFHNVTINTRSTFNVNSGFLCNKCVGGNHTNFESYSNGGAAQIDFTGSDSWNNILINPDIENQVDALNQGANNIGIRMTGVGNKVLGGHISALVTGMSLVDCDGCEVSRPLCINSQFGEVGGFSMDACVKTDALSHENFFNLAGSYTGVTTPLSVNASGTLNTALIAGELRMQGAFQSGATPGMLALASPAPLSGLGSGALVLRARRSTSTNGSGMRAELAATDTAGNSQEYGGLLATIVDSTSTSEDSSLAGEIVVGGAIVNTWLADASGFSVKRVKTGLATALVAGDFALSAGWGSTASVGTITGTDQKAQFTITSSGTGQGASATCTLTWKDGTWTTAPIVQVVRNGGTGTGVTGFTWVASATTLVITNVGTPIAGETYVLTIMAIG